jgi:uncharacterized membrane protein YczE
MQQIKRSLSKRRKIGFVVLLSIAVIGYFIHYYYPFRPPNYISAEYRMPLVYFLIAYKIIELGIFYLIFYRKHYLKLLEAEFHIHILEKFEKNAKRFFFLVPQGSIVFGILSYKLSGEIGYLWIFLCIAASTLFLVNPKKLME